MLCMMHPTVWAMETSPQSTSLEPIPETFYTRTPKSIVSLADYQEKQKNKKEKLTAYIASKKPTKKINPFLNDKINDSIDTDEHWLQKEFRKLQKEEDARCCSVQ